MRYTMVLALLALPMAGCDVDQTEEGSLPEVTAEGGNLPEYDVDTADVNVGTTEETVTTPDIDVSTDETQVDVPTIDVEPADADQE